MHYFIAAIIDELSSPACADNGMTNREQEILDAQRFQPILGLRNWFKGKLLSHPK
jgi:hypothetical protein